MLFMIVIGLVLLTAVLIAAGLWLMQQDASSRQPTIRPAAPALELPASSGPVLPPGLPWKRPFWVSPALTRWNAGMAMTYGIGLIVSLPFAFYWVSGFAARDWSEFSLFGCIFMLPFVVVPLLIVGIQVWMMIKGVLDWQKVKALEEGGQLTQGVLFDRWSGMSRRSRYCVAYSFELPWGSSGGGPVIRAEVNQEAHLAYRIGDPVQVRYLPDNPQVCRLEM